MINDLITVLGLLLIETGVLMAARSPRLGKLFDILPPVFFIYFIPMVLSSTGVISTKAPVLGMITTYLLPVSLFLLLVVVDVPAIARLGGKALFMFFAGSMGIMVGAAVSFSVFKGIVGGEFASGFGALSASWTGGSANMIAVKEALSVPDAVFTPMVVVDTICPYIWMGLLIAAVRFAPAFDQWNRAEASSAFISTEGEKGKGTRQVKWTLTGMALALGIALVAAFFSRMVAGWLPLVKDVITPYAWTIIVVSALALVLSFTPFRRLETCGANRLGTWVLYFVLTAIGARAPVTSIGTAAILIGAGALILLIHAFVLLGAARLVRAPLFLVAAASQANVGGVASAPVVAAVYAPGLASVGLLMAILGNIVGTYFGILVGQWCRFLACGVVLVLFCVFVPSGSAAELAPLPAPSVLEGVTQDMRSAGFWITRHPWADKTIMLPGEAQGFNARLAADGIVTDLPAVPEMVDGTYARREVERLVSGLRGRSFFLSDGKSAGVETFVPLLSWAFAGLNGQPQALRYGFAVAEADERILPTDKPFLAKPGDVDFDELQNSRLDIGEPVLILHQTPDGKWLFVKDEIASGWVRAEKVAFCERGDFLKLISRRENGVVIVAARADLFSDDGLKRLMGTARMGTYFSVRGADARSVQVTLPRRFADGSMALASAFIAREDVSMGPLMFTPRNIYKQAFKLLDAPYGWGDMNGGQDCSRFLQMIFATVGIKLPRNSWEQAKAGNELAAFTPRDDEHDKEMLLRDKAVGALTLLRLKGHIMLYLGQEKGVPYAIHSSWAYRQKEGRDERPRVIGRVAVTGLGLGRDSKKGSLLSRIVDVRLLTLPVSDAVLK